MSEYSRRGLRAYPLPGKIYRHYKGKVAMILGVADPIAEENLLYMPIAAIAQSTDKDGDQSIVVKRSTSGDLCYPGSADTSPPLVIYACSGRVWARSLDEFTDEVADDVRRFDLIPVPAIAFRQEAASAAAIAPLPLVQELGMED
jgi:hypothetical protein